MASMVLQMTDRMTMFSQKMMNRDGDLVVAVVVPSGDGGGLW